jgi:hypothetical protein
MATSETLRFQCGLFFSAALSKACALKTQRFPNLLCLSFVSCRLPYPGGSNDFIWTAHPSLALLSPIIEGFSNRILGPIPDWPGV